MILRRRQAALNAVTFGLAALAGWALFHAPLIAHTKIATTAPSVKPTIAMSVSAR